MDFTNIPLAAAITAFGVVAAGPISTIVNSIVANRNAKNKLTQDASIANEQKQAAILVAVRVEAAAVKVAAVSDNLAASTSRTDAKLASIEETQNTIHTLVNSRLSEALEYISKLERLLEEVSGRVPIGEPSQAQAQAQAQAQKESPTPGSGAPEPVK